MHGRGKKRYEKIRGIPEITIQLPEVTESCTNGTKNAGTGVSISKAIGIEADREGDEGAGNDEDIGIDVLDEFSDGGPDDNGSLDGLANGGGGVGIDVLDEFKIDNGGPDKDGSLDDHANGSGGVGINVLDEFKIGDGGPDEDGSSNGHASSEGHEPDDGIDDGGPDD